MINLKLRNTADFSVENGVKIVVYGRAGTGKTTLCSTMPDPVIFSAESGLMALRRHNLPYYEIKSVGDLRDAYTWARSSSEARQFQSVCVDSVSDIAETLLHSTKAGKKDGRAAYGDFNDEMAQVLRDFRDLVGKHVYMSAMQERVTTPEGLTLNGPAMPGKKMSQRLPYLPDLIFQADIHPTEKYHFLRTKADFANDAKDRSGVLDEVERPDLGFIIRKITGS